MSEVCEKNYNITYGNDNDRMKENFIPTTNVVQNETSMGKMAVIDSMEEPGSSVQGNDNNPGPLLLCLPVSTEEEEKMDSDSISDIA